MRRIVVLGLAAGLVLVLAADSLSQQGPKLGKGPGAGRLFDPNTVATVTGVIVKIEYHVSPNAKGERGMHLLLKTDKETIPVFLGPEGYIKKQAVAFTAKDQVKVTGSRVTFEGAPAMIATTVQKGQDILELRNKQGFPKWAGGGRR